MTATSLELTATSLELTASARRALRVLGLVQGVGFRPFVYRIATEAGLSGWVRNDSDGVRIEVQGTPQRLDHFIQRLRAEAPPLARIEAVEASEQTPAIDEPAGFRIEPSRAGPVTTGIGPDTAVCAACLAELFDPADRRWRYPFINCTHCGPRYTITSRLPYDRPNTSMHGFTMCKACAIEYASPVDRRFHAQPDACPACGPRLHLVPSAPDTLDEPHLDDALALTNGAHKPASEWTSSRDNDPVAATLALLQAGKLVAIKGLGGFHLACDARNADAVERLRNSKLREHKPLAIMVANTESLEHLAIVDDASARLLCSPERPIVLVDKTEACDTVLRGVADGMPQLGAMLPYTPVHYLLFHEAAGRPEGTGWLNATQPLALVMTSANPGGEPLAIGNDEALRRLAPMADAFLLHDRDILVRCDDSVMRARPAPRFVRRARGYTPEPIRLAHGGPSVLALGAHLKNTVCLTRGTHAFLSQHIGDLDNAATCSMLEETVAHLMRMLDVTPAIIAHDMHPDYRSTRLAARFAAEHGLPCVSVQHHHAHIAAVVAEHGLSGPVIGLALDGVGLGTDGRAWGGELLEVDGASMRRLAHLRELALPGGDRAAREPWRMAASVLHLLGRGGEICQRFPNPAAATVERMLDSGFNSALTSSMGRWFDAAAGLLGVASINAFEGQAPMLLEGLARAHGVVAPMTDGYRLIEGAGTPSPLLDLTPLLERLIGERNAAAGASLFHETLALALAQWAGTAARARAITDVVLSGGCLLNEVLSDALRMRLNAQALRVHEARHAPPNDAGVSLGQAWVALSAAPEFFTGVR